MRCEVVTTRDGARAVRDLATGEVMHPVGGGRESRDLYVAPSKLEERLRGSETEPLVLLDVGLGAGSNAAEAWRRSELRDRGRPLHIVSFDHTTEALELALRPEHAADFGLDGALGDAARALLADGIVRSSRSTWRLVRGELPAVLDDEPAGEADVVFWDPFSPKSNPGLWSVWAFEALRRRCRSGATVHTYSSATAIRAALLLAGFCVGRGPVTGERETTIAAVDMGDLEHPLGARWLSRLERSSCPFPTDAPGSALDLIRAMPQFDS